MRKILYFFFVSLVIAGFLLLIKQDSFAADTCQGYPLDSSDSAAISNTVQKGICYYQQDKNYVPAGYSDDPSNIHLCWLGSSCVPLPHCSVMTASDYHHDPNYHDISDNVSNCGIALGNQYRCCAPNDQTKSDVPVPPPPCTNFSGTPGSSGCKSVNTALGNIPTDPGGFVGALLGILLSLAGGVALILIIAAGYQLMVSSGNPEKVKEARERLTSAVVGLLLIIFSLVILQTLAVQILKIPGFH